MGWARDYRAQGAADWLPAQPFNHGDLQIGGLAAADDPGPLRHSIAEVVADAFCEIDVAVSESTATGVGPTPRGSVIAVGSDSQSNGCPLWGESAIVDGGDELPTGFARVFSGTFKPSVAAGICPATCAEATCAGGCCFGGGCSTLSRWAQAIGNTAAHEAAHTFGCSHEGPTTSSTCGCAEAMPDATNLMLVGGCVAEADRTRERHFSDAAFATLASNVGLAAKTLLNWDFENTTSGDIDGLEMEVWRPLPPIGSTTASATMTLTWAYGGAPWAAPAIAPLSSGSVSDAGVADGNVPVDGGVSGYPHQRYVAFHMRWSIGQSWSGGSPGKVPAGATFHVGLAFSDVDRWENQSSLTAPGAVIVRSVKFLKADGAGGLTLVDGARVSMPGVVTALMAEGRFMVRFVDLEQRGLRIKDLVVMDLPRPIPLDAMVRNGPLETWNRRSVKPWRSQPLGKGGLRTEKGIAEIEVANVAMKRHLMIDRSKLPREPRPPGDKRDAEPPPTGFDVSLFPGTTMYLQATIVDPNGTAWDAAAGRYVTRPVESRVYFQQSGIHPDLNHNGVDDAVDIASGAARDEDGNGIPDPPRVQSSCRSYPLIFIPVALALLLLFFIYRRRA